jgi:hypothetical protein
MYSLDELLDRDADANSGADDDDMTVDTCSQQARMRAIAEQIYDAGDREGGVDYEELDHYEERTRWACECILEGWFAMTLAHDDRLYA